jgi:hypothetical protein
LTTPSCRGAEPPRDGPDLAAAVVEARPGVESHHFEALAAKEVDARSGAERAGEDEVAPVHEDRLAAARVRRHPGEHVRHEGELVGGDGRHGRDP